MVYQSLFYDKHSLVLCVLVFAYDLQVVIQPSVYLLTLFWSRLGTHKFSCFIDLALFEKFNAQVPLREVATPDSVARTVVWLLEDAAYTTGEMIKIDSGMHLLGFQP